MKSFFRVLILAVAIAAIGCAESPRKSNVEENIENAKRQIGDLLRASEQDGEIRIPSTFENGAIEFVPTDDWVSGFFAGTLWYMYELTGEECWAEHAKRHTEILDSIQYLKWHHDVGFMIYDSYGHGLRLKGYEEYKQVIVNTAASLSTRFRDVPGVIQSWDADRGWQAKRGWECPVIIDNMMNLELMFKATELSGDSTYYNIAIRHADRTLKEHFREDYSCYHVVDYGLEDGSVRRRCTAQGCGDESVWSRGQAWAIYGYATCYRITGDERYLNQALNVVEFFFNDERLPEDKIPYWDFDAPNIPNESRDVSTATIIASALYEIYTYTKDESHKALADELVATLSSPAYRAEPGTNGGFILMHSVGSHPHGSNIDQPLNYADYYFLEALVRKSKIERGEPLF